MADTRTETQFSVFLVNKPGVLAQVTGALAKAKLNVIAMTLVDSQEHGDLRLVFDDAEVAGGGRVALVLRRRGRGARRAVHAEPADDRDGGALPRPLHPPRCAGRRGD